MTDPRPLLFLMCCATILLSEVTRAQQPTTKADPSHRLIVGWDDAVIVCGPGTDAGMDSPEAIERMVKRWKARGYAGVYWRVDEAMLPDPFSSRWPLPKAPGQKYLMDRVDHTLARFPVIKTLLAAAEREKLEVWAWYPTILSNGAPATGPDFKYPWAYENRFGVEHPEVLSVDRNGRKQYMVWEYAYPEARRAKVAEFVQFAKDYGFKRFVACLRTEAAQNQPAPKHADQFGFNAPIVAEMKRRHGVDITTDPRFDFTDPNFRLLDPMLENWRSLRGEYLTQFFRELKTALHPIDPAIQIAVQIPGDRAGTCLGNWHLNWRQWIDEGLINEIVVPVVLDGYEGYGSTEKARAVGYIDAMVTCETVRAYVAKSRRPKTKVIQAGGPATSPSPPAHADGWRLDSWPDLWTYNMAQRWEQWQQDATEFGHIKFLQQTFDDAPEKSPGGFGDFCHRPDLRFAPGFWEILGDGSDARPTVQSQVRRGTTGRAMKLTRAADGSANLTARHFSRHDRRNYPFPGDTAICSGVCELSFWVQRADANSALVAYMQDDIDTQNGSEIGLFIPPGETSAVFFRQAGNFVASPATISIGKWFEFTIRVDLQRRVYGIQLRADDEQPRLVCQNVAYRTLHNAFNKLEFSPQGAAGSVFFLDDVAWRWTPAVLFEPKGQMTVVREGFESQTLGENWKISGHPSDIRTDSDISFGKEYRSLRIRGAGGLATLSAPTLTWGDHRRVVVDFDLFPKSDQFHTYITPSEQATGTDDVGFAVYGNERSKPTFEMSSQGGRWHLRSGENRVDTNQPVTFDSWSHVQIVGDPQQREFRVLIQVLGEPPRELGRVKLFSLPTEKENLRIEFACRREKTRADGPAFDNLAITADPLNPSGANLLPH